MFNKKLITLFLALFFFYSVNAAATNEASIIKKKDEVLKIDPLEMENGKCPQPGLPIVDEKKCQYSFLCQGDTCFSSDNQLLASSVFVQQGQSLKELLLTGKCKNNDECLSGNCKYGECDSTGIIECTIPRDTTAMKCGIPALGICQNNDECASAKCTEGKCELVYQKEVEKILGMVSTTAIIIVILALCCCCGIGACIFCCCKKKRSDA